jgi:hypothetical protein
LKKIFFLNGLLVAVILLMTASLSCSSNEIKASLGHELNLPVGKTAVISGENLELKFVEVTGDSRCPKGVQCVWAGEAKCLMLITYYKSISSVVFTQSGGDVAREIFNQYKISFTLEPYPESGKQIAKSDYELLITITK